MARVNIHEAKTHLSRYAKRVKAGETFILCDRNVPFAELRPLSGKEESKDSKRPLGLDEGLIHFSEDWDSAETNQEIAQMVGMDHLDDVHTL